MEMNDNIFVDILIAWQTRVVCVAMMVEFPSHRNHYIT